MLPAPRGSSFALGLGLGLYVGAVAFVLIYLIGAS